MRGEPTSGPRVLATVSTRATSALSRSEQLVDQGGEVGGDQVGRRVHDLARPRSRR